MFLKHPAINYFQAFDNLYSANAVVAYAKGALVYLSILQVRRVFVPDCHCTRKVPSLSPQQQELYMLGSPSAEEGIIKAFAQRAAEWLQDRMDWHTNIDVCLHTVADASSLSSEPISIRASCRNEDVYDRVWGCSHIGGFSPTATMVRVANVALYVPHACTTLYSPSAVRDQSQRAGQQRPPVFHGLQHH